MLRRFWSSLLVFDANDKSQHLQVNGVRRLRVRLHRALPRRAEHYETRHRGVLRPAERHGVQHGMHRGERHHALLLHGHPHDWQRNRGRFHGRRRTFLRHRR